MNNKNVEVKIIENLKFYRFGYGCVSDRTYGIDGLYKDKRIHGEVKIEPFEDIEADFKVSVGNVMIGDFFISNDRFDFFIGNNTYEVSNYRLRKPIGDYNENYMKRILRDKIYYFLKKAFEIQKKNEKEEEISQKEKDSKIRRIQLRMVDLENEELRLKRGLESLDKQLIKLSKLKIRKRKSIQKKLDEKKREYKTNMTNYYALVKKFGGSRVNILNGDFNPVLC